LLADTNEGDDGPSTANTVQTTPLEAYQLGAMSGLSAVTVQAFAVAFAALVWILVFSNMPLKPLPLFGYHPIIQVRTCRRSVLFHLPSSYHLLLSSPISPSLLPFLAVACPPALDPVDPDAPTNEKLSTISEAIRIQSTPSHQPVLGAAPLHHRSGDHVVPSRPAWRCPFHKLPWNLWRGLPRLGLASDSHRYCNVVLSGLVRRCSEGEELIHIPSPLGLYPPAPLPSHGLPRCHSDDMESAEHDADVSNCHRRCSLGRRSRSCLSTPAFQAATFVKGTSLLYHLHLFLVLSPSFSCADGTYMLDSLLHSPCKPCSTLHLNLSLLNLHGERTGVPMMERRVKRRKGPILDTVRARRARK
jgi:hypothetical protein